jgi:hypothetical protein
VTGQGGGECLDAFQRLTAAGQVGEYRAEQTGSGEPGEGAPPHGVLIFLIVGEI